MTLDVDFHPEHIHPTAFIAPGAVVVGQVTLGEEVSVWFNATLRADTTPVTIGARSNIQEGAVFHADPGFPAEVGQGVTVGHRAVVHGAAIGDNVTIGMGAILLNGASIGPNSIVGAGALVTQGKSYPPGVLLLGSPATVIRDLRDDEIAGIRASAETYVARRAAFRARYGRGW